MTFDVSQITAIWAGGGWVMLPLFGLATLLYAQAFQLLLYVRKTDLGSGRELLWWDWVRKPEAAEGRVGDVIEYTQVDVSSAKEVRGRFDEVRSALVGLVERRTKFLGTLVAAAPLLGLLGTVLGMLQTFYGISTSGGAETAGVVAEGISEALVTTQDGPDDRAARPVPADDDPAQATGDGSAPDAPREHDAHAPAFRLNAARPDRPTRGEATPLAKRSILSEEDATTIELSPMIDCIFILLIFFIVTTVFVEETGVQVAKPDAAAAASLEENENVVLEITAEGKVLLEEREVAVADITSQLQKHGIDGDTPVVIRSHEKATHRLFVSVWDAAKLAGARMLSFNTVN